jgi:hypothetical protein
MNGKVNQIENKIMNSCLKASFPLKNYSHSHNLSGTMGRWRTQAQNREFAWKATAAWREAIRERFFTNSLDRHLKMVRARPVKASVVRREERAERRREARWRKMAKKAAKKSEGTEEKNKAKAKKRKAAW